MPGVFEFSLFYMLTGEDKVIFYRTDFVELFSFGHLNSHCRAFDLLDDGLVHSKETALSSICVDTQLCFGEGQSSNSVHFQLFIISENTIQFHSLFHSRLAWNPIHYRMIGSPFL